MPKYNSDSIPHITRNLPNPFRALLIEFIWDNRDNLSQGVFLNLLDWLRNAIRGRTWVDKRNGLLEFIRFAYEVDALTKRQFNKLVDALDKSYPLSSFSTPKKGQCPFALASPIFNKTVKQLKARRRHLTTLFTLTGNINRAVTITAKILAHNPLFVFLEKQVKIDIRNCNFLNYCPAVIKKILALYDACEKELQSKLPTNIIIILEDSITGLKEAKLVNDKIFYHRNILDILKKSNLPKKIMTDVLEAEKLVCKIYKLNL